MNFRLRGESVDVSKPLAWLASVVGSIAVISGAAFWLITNLAWASDIAAIKESVKELAKQSRVNTEYAVDKLRKQNLEDQIFAIQLVPESRRTDAQRAMLDRFQSQAREVDQRWMTPPPTSLVGQ